MTQASKLNLVDSLDFTPEVSSREMSLFDRLAVEFRLIEIKTKARHERGKKMLLSILRLKRQQKENIKKSDLSQINDYMKTLSMLLSSYEAVSFAVGNTAPNEMLKYLMELNKVTQVDLSEEIGSQPIVSKVLKGDRPLKTIEIKRLARRFNVGAEVFL